MAFRNRRIVYPPFPDYVPNVSNNNLESTNGSTSTTDQAPVSNPSLSPPHPDRIASKSRHCINQTDSTGTRHVWLPQAPGRRQQDVPTFVPTPKLSSTPIQLPPGWIRQRDSTGNRHFYIHPPTGRSQWEFPTPTPETSAPSPYVNTYFRQAEKGVPYCYFPPTNSYSQPTSFGTSAGSVPPDHGKGWSRSKENLVSFVVPRSAIEVQKHAPKAQKAQKEIWHPSKHLAKLVSVWFPICD